MLVITVLFGNPSPSNLLSFSFYPVSFHVPGFDFLPQFLAIPHYSKIIYYLLYLLSSLPIVPTTINYSSFFNHSYMPRFSLSCELHSHISSCTTDTPKVATATRPNSPSSYKISSPSPNLGSGNHSSVVLPHSHHLCQFLSNISSL